VVAPCSSCAVPWGGTIATGTSLSAYPQPGTCGVNYCVPVTRTCNSGVLSGTASNQNCNHIDCCGSCCVTGEYCRNDGDCCGTGGCDSSTSECY
jgi:hypothetical protein